VIQSCSGYETPQTGQRVDPNVAPHFGHWARVSNVSKAVWQLPHPQNAPARGAV
jgi:hypothetical protein